MALKIAGYFTADEGPYRRAVLSLFREYMQEDERDTIPAPSPEEPAAILSVSDPERLLHTEAVMAAHQSMDGVWESVREERNAALREP